MQPDKHDSFHVSRSTGNGGDPRELRRRAIERCGTLNIPITLAMTVTPENLPHLWRARKNGPSPVSYTHLTLPTIYSV